jgi:hypothetical protein
MCLLSKDIEVVGKQSSLLPSMAAHLLGSRQINTPAEKSQGLKFFGLPGYSEIVTKEFTFCRDEIISRS